MRNWLKNAVVVLTGASSGIGRQLCKILIARYGARVVGVGRNEEKMRSLQAELGDYKQNFSYSLFDVSDETAWRNFATELQEKGISPSVLINNAGAFPTFSRTLKTPIITTEEIMRTNFFSVVYSVNAIAPIMTPSDNKKPYILNVCSSASLCTVVGTSAYTASKCAMKGYTESLALDENARLRVGIIYPGMTKTDLFRKDENTNNSILDKVATSPKKMARKIAGKIYKRKRRAVVGWDAKLMNITAKLMPVKGLFFIRFIMKKSHSKVFTNVFADE